MVRTPSAVAHASQQCIRYQLISVGLFPAILTPFCSLDNTEFASPRWINSGFWVEHSLFLLVNLCKSLLLAIAFGSLTRLLAVIETVLFSYATMHEMFICFFFSHQLGLRGVANPFAIGRNRKD